MRKMCFCFRIASAYNHEIIRVSDVISDPKRMLHVLIEFVEVYICKELRGEIANGDAFSTETSDDLPQEPDYPVIFYSAFNNAENPLVIHRCKELVNIALESKARTSTVPTHAS